MLSLIGNILRVVIFFLGLWVEKDKEKSEIKKDIAKEIVDAFAKTDKEERISSLNSAVGRIKRMQ